MQRICIGFIFFQMSRPLLPIDEIVFEDENGFTTKYGTTISGKIPTVYYLRSKGRLTPKTKKKNYKTEVIEIKKSFGEYLKKNVGKEGLFDSNFISSIDISEKTIGFGKKSYIKYDIYLKPLKIASFEEHQQMFHDYSNHLNGYLCDLLSKYDIEMA